MEIDRQLFEENENIQHWDKIKMSSMGDLLNRKPKPKSKAYNSKSALAEEIYNHWNKKLSYPMILKFIKNNGEQCVFEIFNESKDKGVGLFIWLNNKHKTLLKDI
jgi:hypothetical protein